MGDIFYKIKRFSLFSPIVASLVLSPTIFAAKSDKKEPPAPQHFPVLEHTKVGEGYIINFNNVSIIEFLRFVSRIGSVNFIYEEADLQFPITLTSEAPASIDDILAALVQILRAQGFELIDQGQNLIINRNPDVKQIATVVSEEVPFDSPYPAPMVTRVFRVHNTSPVKLVGLIKPLLSKVAIIDAYPETHQIIVTDNTANVDKVALLLRSLDAPHLPLEIDAYIPKEGTPDTLIKLAEEIMKPLAEGNPVIMIPQIPTNTIFIISTPYLIERTIAVLEDLDNPMLFKELKDKNLLLYKLQYKPAEEIEAALNKIALNLTHQGYNKEGIIDAIETMRYIKENHSLLFSGDSEALAKIKDLLALLDVQGTISSYNSQFYLYKPLYKSPKEIQKAFYEIGQSLINANLSDPDFIFTVRNIQEVGKSDVILFTGNDETLKRVKEILPSIDVPSREERIKATIGPADSFYMYTPLYRSGKELVAAIDALVEDLVEAELADPSLIASLDSVKYEKKDNTLLFTGNKETLARVKEILGMIDTADKSQKKELYIYKLQYITESTAERALDNLARSLPNSDPMKGTLESGQWMSASNSFAFRGPAESIDRLKEIFTMIDTPAQAQKASSEQKTYTVYKLQNANGSTVIKDLDTIRDNLKGSRINNPDLLQALKEIEWIQATNSLYITGTPSAIKEVQDLIQNFDVARPETTKFFIYKPRYGTAKEVRNSLLDIADTLQDAHLVDYYFLNTIESSKVEKNSGSLLFTGTDDSITKLQELLSEVDAPDQKQIKSLGPTTFLIYQPRNVTATQLMQSLKALSGQIADTTEAEQDLIQTIKTMRYIKESNTIIFTGPEDVLQKVESLLTKLDNPSLAPIQKVGKSSFFVYQPKYVSVTQLAASLKTLAGDYSLSENPDESLINVINNMRYSDESKSIVFTGPEPTLEKVQGLIEKFDNPALAEAPPRTEPDSYQLYTPKYQHGEELIGTLQEFEKNLIAAGVQESDLFDVINNLKWMEKTCNILISGAQDSVQEVDALLTRFDVPLDSAPETEIETFDDVSFLIYKLQYHRGDALESALKLVAADLKKRDNSGNKKGSETPSAPSNTLVDAIDSVQWIEVTNSLIATGPPQTLVKLKELLKSLDVPLRQVYIEVLVIETQLTSDLDLGLRWGTQGVNNNQFAWGSGSFPSFGSSTDPAITFNQSLQNITATNTPLGQNIPFVSGFDLGVIGDIIFHKGKSYASLGSFLNAAKTDGDITVVLDQKLVTQDGKNSTLFVGDNLPFTGSTVTNQGNNTTLTTNIEYMDIGVNLSITPTLGDDDIITLTIDEEITEVIDNPTGSSSSDSSVIATGISTSKTSTTTSVAVPDRKFLVLSGMIRNTNTHQVQSIPCLGGIPIIGLAFQEKQTSIVKNNVIIFLKPHIIHSFEEYRKITTQQEDLYRCQAVPEKFDEGICLVQTPDDE